VKHSPVLDRSFVGRRLLVSIAFIAVVATSAVTAVDYPSWWNGVLKSPPATADDYAALNQGQLKNFALAACDEFKARLITVPGGAGPGILAIENQLTVVQNGQRVPRVTTATDNYAAATVGQLKALAKPFYDRLRQLRVLDYDPYYPWSDPDDNNAVANLGQAKHVFNYDFDGDTDGDGLSDFVELSH
jgi:hypothetical protein